MSNEQLADPLTVAESVHSDRQRLAMACAIAHRDHRAYLAPAGVDCSPDHSPPGHEGRLWLGVLLRPERVADPRSPIPGGATSDPIEYEASAKVNEEKNDNQRQRFEFGHERGRIHPARKTMLAGRALGLSIMTGEKSC